MNKLTCFPRRSRRSNFAKAAPSCKMIVTPGQNCFGRREIAWIIGVEERIVRLDWPLHNGAAVVLRECFDLSDILHSEGVAEIVSDRDRPDRDGRMKALSFALASMRRAARSPGKNGVSAGTLIAKGTSGQRAAIQSSPRECPRADP